MPRFDLASFTSHKVLFGISGAALAIVSGSVLLHPSDGPAQAAPTATTRPSTTPAQLAAPSPASSGPTTSPAPTTPADTTPPVLTITGITNGTIVTSGQLALAGTTEPEALVSVGGLPAPVDGKGNWTTTVTLVPGSNALRVSATDPAGNAVTETVNVILELPPPPTAPPATAPATTKGPSATTAPKPKPPSTGPGTTLPPPDGNNN